MTDEYVFWLPYQQAWHFGIAVRVRVWSPIVLGSRPGGVTALCLFYIWCKKRDGLLWSHLWRSQYVNRMRDPRVRLTPVWGTREMGEVVWGSLGCAGGWRMGEGCLCAWSTWVCFLKGMAVWRHDGWVCVPTAKPLSLALWHAVRVVPHRFSDSDYKGFWGPSSYQDLQIWNTPFPYTSLVNVLFVAYLVVWGLSLNIHLGKKN